jgi:hypothetical protein
VSVEKVSGWAADVMRELRLELRHGLERGLSLEDAVKRSTRGLLLADPDFRLRLSTIRDRPESHSGSGLVSRAVSPQRIRTWALDANEPKLFWSIVG